MVGFLLTPLLISKIALVLVVLSMPYPMWLMGASTIGMSR